MTKFFNKTRALQLVAFAATASAGAAMAQSNGGLDVGTAVTEMKTQALAGIGTAGTAILAIVAAIVVLGIIIRVFKK